jgi:hypothetical protein
MYKLTYHDGTVVETDVFPANFTGTVGYHSDGSKTYYAKGKWHRDGGLPAYEGSNGYTEYRINGKRTGTFFGG